MGIYLEKTSVNKFLDSLVDMFRHLTKLCLENCNKQDCTAFIANVCNTNITYLFNKKRMKWMNVKIKPTHEKIIQCSEKPWPALG